jgi:hypothetical protein
MSKKYDVGTAEAYIDPSADDNAIDMEFMKNLDSLRQEFVFAVNELQNAHEKYLIEEYIKITSTINASVDTIMEEILNFELLKDMPDSITFEESDVKRLAGIGVKLLVKVYPTPISIHFKDALKEAKDAAQMIMSKGKIASETLPSPASSAEMLRSIIPCGMAVKKIITLGKEATMKVRLIGSEERRKRDEWKKECLANERVKKLFQMWESQVIEDSQTSNKKNYNALNQEELDMLTESTEGLVFDEATKLVKGGRLGKLVEIITSHVPNSGIFHINNDQNFVSAFFMTHHSFTTSSALIELLFKRYEITPPYGLNQRSFEIFLDKKIVQVRLKVCHVLLHWVQNYFEEDFVDNDFLILRFRDFISKKVTADFEHMSVQILQALEQKLSEQDQQKLMHTPSTERDRNVPKPLLPTFKFGGIDPLSNLSMDPRILYEIEPLETARQLTLIEHELFCKVQSYECLDQIWESHYRKEVAANSNKTEVAQRRRHLPGSSKSDISKLISHTNDITFYVSTCIVNNDTLKARVNALKYFISVAQVFDDLHRIVVS